MCNNSPEKDVFEGANLVVLVETFAKKEPVIPGYKSSISPAIDGAGRRLEKGIAILVKPHLKHKEISSSENHLVISLETFTLACFYFIPLTTVEDVIEDILNAISGTDKNKPLLIAGDFNCRTDSGTRGEELASALATFGFYLENDPSSPTYISPNGCSTIDLIFSNDSSFIKSPIELIDSFVRKHKKIRLHLNSNYRENRSQDGSKRFRGTKFDPGKVEEPIHLDKIEEDLKGKQLDSAAQNIANLLLGAAPEKETRKFYNKPWFDGECQKLKKLLRSMPKGNDRYWRTRRQYKNLLREKKNLFEEKELNDRICAAEIKLNLGFFLERKMCLYLH